MNINMFPMLAIETSSELCSVAVLFDEKKYAEFNYLDKHIHSENLILFIQNLISSSKLNLSDFRTLAVSSGPGSFTGIRIGYSAAKGIAFGLGIPLIPVPTFGAFALEISKFYKIDIDFSIAVKANTTELYYGEFSKVNDSIHETKSPELINKFDLSIYAGEKLVFTDFRSDNVLSNYCPKAFYAGEWAFNYGKEKITFDYDFIEPDYIKKFIPKVKNEK